MKPVKSANTRSKATAIGAVLAVDGLIHLYWATGRTWPVHSTTRLSQLVLNTQVPFTPQVLVPLAGLLFSGATLVLVHGGRLPALARRLPAVLPRWGSRAVAAGLLARGAVGLVWVTGAWADPGDMFYWLNLLLYTPLCLLLGRAAWQVSAAGAKAGGVRRARPLRA
ncbi:DUF3995 domain-containing protein [Streptomyces sp. NBC_01591]|uniref:DUF3995 domain-containing protein n=1 Tax=Streptomyces sp. NBC_01591 TaxID=2975888 RepID=UPI002DDC513E|nr:DUF3995 domain-containing protein [Streptomyces sp. NBC_01591]WSD66237.1 DUF3995 domain-containing protein [Streptomyces sp. NBC_01591]